MKMKIFVAVSVTQLTSQMHHKYKGIIGRYRYSNHGIICSGYAMLVSVNVLFPARFYPRVFVTTLDHPVSNGTPVPHQVSDSQSEIILTVEDTWEMSQKVFVGTVVGTDIR